MFPTPFSELTKQPGLAVVRLRDGRAVAQAGGGALDHEAALTAMVAAMRSPPERLVAWLGPAAGPAEYEVGDEVRDAFARPSAFVATRPGHWRVDLFALARLRLAAAGLAPGAIHGGGLSTIADPARFFSHRRDQRTGRMATLVWRQARASAAR